MENENLENGPLTPPPITPDANNEFAETRPERGGCLTAFLILMIIGNVLAVFLYLVMGEKIARTAHIPSYAPYIMILFGIVNIICAYLIYNFKRSGVYGIVISGAITLIVNLALGLGPTSFGGIVGIIILVALVSPHWEHFD
jgi:hypothetical protein